MKIGVVNAWGSNRGDEAMQSSLLCFLNSLDKNIETTIYTNSWVDLIRHKNVTVQRWLKPNDIFSKQSPRNANIYGILGLLFPQLLSSSMKDKFCHDFIISSPAGPYFGDLYLGSEPKCLWQMAMCNSRDIPFGVLATSSGPFNKTSRNILRKRLLSKAKFWTVRETFSQANLKSLNLDVDTYVGSDLVFAHPYRELKNFQSPLEMEEFGYFLDKATKKPFVVVTLNMTPFLGANGEEVPFDAISYIRDMGKLLAHVLKTTDNNIVFMPHFYGEWQEQRLIKEIISLLNEPYRTHVLNPMHNCETQMYLYKKAEFAISHRYHPTIFAAKAECPFMCIRHQFKVDGMLKMFSDPGPKVTSLDSPEKWIKAFDESWQSKAEIKSQVQKHLPQVLQASKLHLDVLEKYLNAL